MKLLFSFMFLLIVSRPVFCQDITTQDADSLRKAIVNTSPGIDRIYMLIHLAKYQVLKPGELKIDFDSAQAYLNEAARLNISVKSADAEAYRVLTEAKLVNEKGQKEEAKKMVEQAVAKLESGSNKTYLGMAYYDLSMFYDFWYESQQKIIILEKAIKAYNQAGNTEGRAHSLKMIGDILANDGQLAKSVDYLNMALAAYDSVNYQRVHGVYIMLANVYRHQSDFKRALIYAIDAVKIGDAVHDTTMQMCQINHTLGAIYKEAGRNEMAIKYFKKSLNIAMRFNDLNQVSLIVMNISGTYNSFNPQEGLDFLASLPKKYKEFDTPDEKFQILISYFILYVMSGQYDKAKPLCAQLVKLSTTEPIKSNVLAIDNVKRALARYYVETGQFAIARTYMGNNSYTLGGFNDPKRIAAMARLLYKIDSAEGHFKSSLDHHILYKTMTDSVFNISKAREVQLLEVEYETEKKQDSIRLKDADITMLTQRNSIQEANLKQAAFFRNVTIGGILLTLIIIGLLYRQYRQKQQTNLVISDNNKQLKHLLTEKEWLLKEIHHRVKNNLQVVMSLLNSQSAYLENDIALTAIHDSQHRVHAMSLIHQKLYNSDNVSSIDMPSYIRELVSYLRDSFNTGQHIRFEFNTDPLELDVSQAVPLGLILNEAITNSLKYAFSDGRDGLISISLSNTSLNNYLLTIKDNGIGMPADFAGKKAGSLGMSLMSGLSEDLDGKFSIESNNGTTVKVSFVHDHDLTVKRSDSFSSSLTTSN